MKRRVLSMFLVFLMVLYLVPASALADEGNVPEGYAAEDITAEETSEEEAIEESETIEEPEAAEEPEVIKEPETVDGPEAAEESGVGEQPEVADGTEAAEESEVIEESEVSEVPEDAEDSEIIKDEEPAAEPEKESAEEPTAETSETSSEEAAAEEDKEPAEKPAEDAAKEAAEEPAEAAVKDDTEDSSEEPAESEETAKKDKNPVTEEEPAYNASSGKCGANLNWEVSLSGVLTITGDGDMYDFTITNPKEPLPWADYADLINTVVLPEGLTRIGNYAFIGCSNMTEINLPSSLESIGSMAFRNCTGLASIDFTGSAPAIASDAFSGCTLTAYYMPVESLGWTSDVLQDYGGTLTWVCDNKCGTDLTWALSGSGVLTISGTGAMYDWSNWWEAPWYQSTANIRSVVVENGATSIGSNAFADYYTALTSVTLPDSLTNIGSYAFYNCKALTTLNIGNGLENIRLSAFQGCSALTDVTLPDSLTSIGNNSFKGCSSLTEITIPAGVTSIAYGAFMSCSGLKDITFAGSAPSIGNEVFSGVTAGAYYPVGDTTWTADVRQNYGGTITWANGRCGDNVYWTLDSGMLTIFGTGDMYDYSSSDTAPWYSYRNSITSLVVESGATSIGRYAFYSCESLTSATLPSGITKIGRGAFCACTSLTAVTIPDTVTSIGGYSFYRCYHLTDLTLSDNLKTIEEVAFCNCSSLKTITIPASVTRIAETAFDYCRLSSISVASGNTMYTSIDGVMFTADKKTLFRYPGGKSGDYTVPDAVTSIGVHAFENADELTSIIIPDSVESIGIGAFYFCTSLKDITIPAGVKTIENITFAGCKSLTSIVIPGSVTIIKREAFSYCNSLTGITFMGSAPTIATDAFVDVTATAYYPSGDSSWTSEVMQDYGGTLTWSGCPSGTCGANGDNVTWILIDGELTISGTGPMTDFKNPSGFIPATPWRDYRLEITSVIIEPGATTIGNLAFCECTNLVSVSIPGTVTRIGNESFHDCYALTDLTIPYGVTEIDNNAFLYCESLTNVTIPDSVTSIGVVAFGHTGLTEVEIHAGIISLGTESGGAFTGCPNLTAIKADPGNPNYSSADGVLFNKDKTRIIQYPAGKAATVYTIPNTVTTIGPTAFEACKKLTEITIPDSVTTIDTRAFGVCEGLTGITIPESVTTIEDAAFFACRALKEITIPASVTSIGQQVFLDDNKLEKIIFKGFAPSMHMHAFLGVSCPIYYYPVPGWDAVVEAYPSRTWVCDNKCGDDLTWYLDSDGTLTISGTGATWDFGYDYPGFYNFKDSITSAVFENGVTGIGINALYWCSSITDITLGDSMKSIGTGAFWACISLKSITLPTGVTDIGRYAFDYCSALTDIVIPDSVTSIGEGAFYGCSSMKSITFEGSAPAFGTNCFEEVTATAYYPAGDPTWTESVRQNYGGTITWVGVVPLPEITSVGMSTEGVALTWKSVPGATKYEISRTEEAGSGAEFTTVEGKTDHTDKEVKAAETYTYRIRAYAGGKWTDYGEEKTVLFNPFEDIDPKTQKKTFNFVSWAYNNEIVKGTTNTTFSPDDSCTRIQFVMMLWKMNGKKTVKGTNPFKDISGNTTTKAILWALDAGIINSGEYFDPNGNISRIQIVMMLWKMNGSPTVKSTMPFEDVSGPRTIKAVKWAYNNGKGITTGTSDTTFSPNDPCTRVQLVFFLRKYNDLYHVI